ncbi:hypothetical protein Bequi_03675 [Brachybacterium sp. JHP9]|uniref:DUF2975 domain-containing protein n=1 Tax=Brachybacterium equifaecis TaxID=2910770 RepID=A0ABT0QXV0_9MICO|nr:hypothetical protein [Brachybacterium equifaecis]MCL6422491.1 hypothetical protein [Brachybacterium equifaecis]
MNRTHLLALRAVLLAALLGCIVLQLRLPQLSETIGGGYEETRALVGPYAVAGILALLLLEAAIVLAWCGIEARERGSLTRRAASRVGTASRLLLGCAGLVALIPPAHLLVGVGVGGPGILLAAGALALMTLIVLASAVPRDPWAGTAPPQPSRC